MNRRIRFLAIAVLGLFAVLFVNLNIIQVVRARDLASDPRNAVRQLERTYANRRGSILLADGRTEVATVTETDGPLRWRRVYPEGPMYAHVTGYASIIFGKDGLERTADDVLSPPVGPLGTLAEALAGTDPIGDTVVSSVLPEVQRTARAALAGQAGAVVALDPRTGELLASVSEPTYDPGELASFDPSEVRAAWTRLNDDPGRPLLDRTARRLYAPGSTFKLVTAAAALERGVDAEDTFADPAALELPLTSATVGNFGGSTCNGGQPITLAQALAVSCNTTFAQLGLDLGAEALVEQAEAFGWNDDLGPGLPLLEPSQIPDADALDEPATAQSAIGQRDVRATPVQMAAVAGAIGSGGVLRAPRLVARVEDAGGLLLEALDPDTVRRPISAATAQTLTEMMVSVVRSGTGTAAALPDVTVAGKTGTAESGDPDRPPTVWFVGFAPAEEPTVAVAVVVERGGTQGFAATGGGVAAPIARDVLSAALAAGDQRTD